MIPFSRSFIRRRVISLATTGLVGVLALAQGPVPAHRTIQAVPVQYVSVSQVGETAFLKEDEFALNRMVADMAMKPSGDVDRDFVAMMVPHQQGAIDMAQAVLRYGQNEQLRRLAREIVATRQQEIAAMRLAVGEALPPSAATSPTQPLPIPVSEPPADCDRASSIGPHRAEGSPMALPLTSTLHRRFGDPA
ncbi:MAG: hypothetical protein JWQ17_4168 [Tardiphaga sp.]|jgi:hypothetical protein|nr:hypothetical protein [Tardiphaga sp.]